jgi:hypothetical protein
VVLLEVEEDRRRSAHDVSPVHERRHELLAGDALDLSPQGRVDVHGLVGDALQIEDVAHLDAVVGERNLEQPHRDASL